MTIYRPLALRVGLLVVIGVALAFVNLNPDAGADGNPLRSFTDVSAGANHTCAITLDGVGQCWGNNGWGQLGSGDSGIGTNKHFPVNVLQLGETIAEVSAGGDHTCAVTSSGGAKCWGRDDLGQLGSSSASQSSSEAVDVDGMQSGVTQVSAGGVHTCAVIQGGGVKCWGANPAGQLGVPVDQSPFCQKVAGPLTRCRTTPVDVTGIGESVTRISAGGDLTNASHTCAVLVSGGVKCWGKNNAGQLGNGLTTDSDEPVTVVGLSGPAQDVATGRQHSCALMSGGGVECWGSNSFGQLGDGTTTGRTTPVEVCQQFVNPVCVLLGNAVGLASGAQHNCAVLTGELLKCWGSNDSGQLGIGPLPVGGPGSAVAVDVCIELLDPDVAECAPPVLSGVVAVTAADSRGGPAHTCALMADASIRCWGDNGSGQLAIGTTETVPIANRVVETRAPAIVLIHGIGATCSSMNTIRAGLRAELGLASERLLCFDYDTGQGPASSTVELALVMSALRTVLKLDPDEGIDIVAHSMGGLVARSLIEGGPDLNQLAGPIDSLSMLGTPNEGAFLAKLPRLLCPDLLTRVSLTLLVSCNALPFSELATGIDPFSDAVTALVPGSDFLDALNAGFTLPTSPEYKVHAGASNDGGLLGFLGLLAHTLEDGDCVVSEKSAIGPNLAHLARFTRWPNLSHTSGLPGCGSDTLTNSSDLVEALVPTILAPPARGGSGRSAQAAGAPGPTPGGAPFAVQELSGVLSSSPTTVDIVVPQGLPKAAFVLMWLDDNTNPELDFTLTRPNGMDVDPAEGDVLAELDIADGIVHLRQKGLVINQPLDGTWKVTATGVTVPQEGQPFMVGLIPETDLTLALRAENTNLDVATPPQPQVITASLFDDTTAIDAGDEINAEVWTPSTTQPVVNITLLDNGVKPDGAAQDGIYTAEFTQTGDCGGYRVFAATSGAVVREQSLYFQVHLLGDQARDPCDTDDDGDGISDDDEFEMHQTNPLNDDTDGDGRTDPDEINGPPITDPRDPDTDDDGMPDGFEVDNSVCGLNALVDDGGLDADNDGLTNLGEFTAATDPCDDDTDDDGLSDGDEVNTHGTDPTSTDTDGDGMQDDFEVANIGCLDPLVGDAGLNPDNDGLTNLEEYELTERTDPCDSDTDDDDLLDGQEVNGVKSPKNALGTLFSEPLILDTDEDGCSDGQELGYVNGAEPEDPEQRKDEIDGAFRNPNSFWDLFAVWHGEPIVRDAAVTITDIGAVVARFGATGDPGSTKDEARSQALALPPPAPAYHAAFDRGAAIPGQNVWNLLPPDGSIVIGDIGAVVAQFGHSCV